MCEMTSLNRGPFRVQYEKNSPHFNFFTLTPWVAWVTNMSYDPDPDAHSVVMLPRQIKQYEGVADPDVDVHF